MPIDIGGALINANTASRITSGVVTSNLVLYLDAGNSSSYPGSGTTWFDLSGNNNNFTINASAYNNTGPKYMDFNGSYGCAKKTDSDLNITGDVTVMCWTRVLNSSSNWRTLLRGLSSGQDHQVIIQQGGWEIGMYDNQNGSGFNGCGYSQQSLPNYNTTNWVCMQWRWNNAVAPYYSFSYNDSPSAIRGTISNSNARFKNGVCSIGAYNNGSQSNPSDASQYWGDIGLILIYSRKLTDQEVLQNYNTFKVRFPT
jgi:hypothetical protein